MPIAITNQFNQSLVNLLSNSNTPPAAQCLALVQTQAKKRRISGIHCGYIALGNIGKTSPYQLDSIQGRLTIIQGGIALDPNTDRAVINSGFNPFDVAINFGSAGSIGKVVLDVPVYNNLSFQFTDDQSLIFNSGDVITVLLSMGFTAIDTSVSSYAAKTGYLTVFGNVIEENPALSNFRVR